MTTGYCTVEDVRRVLQEADLSGPLASEDNQIVVDAIASLSDPIERATKRHWYVEGGVAEDTHDLIPASPKTRDDEHDIQTHGGMVHGASERRRFRFRKNSDALLESDPRTDRRRRELRREPKREIRISTGEYQEGFRDDRPAYTRITLERKDVEAVNKLHVINGEAAFDDWTAEKEGGVGNLERGKDYWVRINNLGVAELYLDVHAMDDDIASLSNAVYIDIDYGHAGLPQNVRRGVALLVASELVLDDELVTAIPDSGQLIGVETKAERWARQGVQKLEAHIVDEAILEHYL